MPVEPIHVTDCAALERMRALADYDQLVRLRIGQRPQQHSVDYAEVAVFAPIPSASAKIATSVTLGIFSSSRTA